MKKAARALMLASLALIGALFFPAAAAGQDVALYREDLTDAGGRVYGANFYIDNNTSARLYAVVYVTSRENAAGGVISGAFLMAPNEKRILVGAFRPENRGRPWAVYVDARWAADASDLTAP